VRQSHFMTWRSGLLEICPETPREHWPCANYLKLKTAAFVPDSLNLLSDAMKARYIWDRATMQLVDPATYYASKPAPQRSHLACPTIHGDFNDYVMCPADGVRYGSKGEYRAALRRNGCVEVGNEPIHTGPSRPEYKADGIRDDLKRTLSQHGVSV
jgi:hypothetical protein